jgi:hypothetical protein
VSVDDIEQLRAQLLEDSPHTHTRDETTHMVSDRSADIKMRLHWVAHLDEGAGLVVVTARGKPVVDALLDKPEWQLLLLRRPNKARSSKE